MLARSEYPSNVVKAQSVGGRQAARLLSPGRLAGAGSSGVAMVASSWPRPAVTHSTPHMSHSHITTHHYLIIGTKLTRLNQYEHLTMLITPIGTIILWNCPCS